MMKSSPRGLLLFLENVSLFLDTKSFQRGSELLLQLARTHFPTGAYRASFQRSLDSALGSRLQEHAHSNPDRCINARDLFRKAFITLSRKREFRPTGQEYFSDLDATMEKIERGCPRNFPLYHDADRFFTLLRRVKKQEVSSNEFPWIDTVVAIGPTRQGKNTAGLLQCSGLKLGGGVSPGSMTLQPASQDGSFGQQDIDIVFNDSITAYGGLQRALTSTKNMLHDVLRDRESPEGITAEDYDILHIGPSSDIAVAAGFGTLKLDRQKKSKEPDFEAGVIPDLRDVKRWTP